MTGRAEIFATVRASILDAPGRVSADAIDARLATPSRGPIPARTDLGQDALVDLFAAQARAVDASVVRIAGDTGIADAIGDYLQSENLPARLIVAPDPALGKIDWAALPMVDVRSGLPQSTDEISVTSALGAVAETGTLVMTSGPHHPSTLNFVPETHIVVVPAAKVCRAYEDVWDQIRLAAAGNLLPRTVNFVTGPSRSADIEQTLQLGAHGPRRLHIILVDDVAAAVSQ